MVKLTRLKEVRQRKALTQQQLAERAGVNRVTIARIEGGKDEPFPTTLRKVADALGVEPEQLLQPVAETRPNGPGGGLAAEDIAFDERIAVRDEPEVRRLLQAHPDLAPVIQEAAEQLIRFIPDARLTLEVLIDPEYGDEELLLGVSTSLPVLEAMEALDRFDEAWWLPNARRASGLFFVNLR